MFDVFLGQKITLEVKKLATRFFSHVLGGQNLKIKNR